MPLRLDQVGGFILKTKIAEIICEITAIIQLRVLFSAIRGPIAPIITGEHELLCSW